MRRYWWVAGFALFIWITVIFARGHALGDELAYEPDRIIAIIITFISLTTFGVMMGRIWDSENRDD